MTPCRTRAAVVQKETHDPEIRARVRRVARRDGRTGDRPADAGAGHRAENRRKYREDGRLGLGGRTRRSSHRGGAGGRGRTGGTAQQGKEGGQRRPMFRRRKVCKFCADKIDDINYKDTKLLMPFVPERAKILPRRISGTCALHQRKLRTAIMRARQLALIPYTSE